MLVGDNPCRIRGASVFELRRGDLDLDAAIVHVRRAVVRVDRTEVVGPAKSDAGIRKVAIPSHVVPLLQDHHDRHVAGANTALLFTTRSGLHWTHGNFYKAAWVPAREAIGMPNLRFHDSGIPQPSWPRRPARPPRNSWPGSATAPPWAALRYQHAADGRVAAIAEPHGLYPGPSGVLPAGRRLIVMTGAAARTRKAALARKGVVVEW